MSLLGSLLASLVGFVMVIGVLGVYVIGKVTAHLVSEEVEGRINQLGYALLHLACKRLPKELREIYYEFWAADLDAYYQNAEHRPLTRLFWSLRFPLPLLFKGRTVAKIMDPKSFEAEESIFKKIGNLKGEWPAIMLVISSVASSVVLLINVWAGDTQWSPLQIALLFCSGIVMLLEVFRNFVRNT